MVTVSRWTGREARALRAAVRMSTRAFAEELGVNVRTVAKWEKLQAGTVPRPDTQAILDTALNRADSATQRRFQMLLAEADTLAGAAFARSWNHEEQTDVPSEFRSGLLGSICSWQGASDIGLTSEAVAVDSRDSVDFLRFASMSNVNSALLDQLDADIVRLARDYVSKPLLCVFPEIRLLRRAVFELLQGRQRPYQTAYLYSAAGRLCGLATHVALDLGQYVAAATHSRTAWQCAEAAGDDGLRAWVRSVQSLIAYWQQDYRRAADIAKSGLPYATVGTIEARLLSLEARAASAIGDTERALRAVESARDARNAYATEAELPGVFSFPEAKQLTYAGTTLLALNSRPRLRRATEASLRAISLYESAMEEDRSSGDLQAARLDLATAYLVNGDIDGVHDALTVVLAVAPDRRTASISKRLHALSARLAEPVYSHSPAVVHLREGVRAACARPALANPPGAAT